MSDKFFPLLGCPSSISSINLSSGSLRKKASCIPKVTGCLFPGLACSIHQSFKGFPKHFQEDLNSLMWPCPTLRPLCIYPPRSLISAALTYFQFLSPACSHLEIFTLFSTLSLATVYPSFSSHLKSHTLRDFFPAPPPLN